MLCSLFSVSYTHLDVYKRQPEEVADILKVRKHTVWNWLREGTLKGTKINGKIWRITDKDLEAFINKEESEV